MNFDYLCGYTWWSSTFVIGAEAFVLFVCCYVCDLEFQRDWMNSTNSGTFDFCIHVSNCY